MKLFLLGAGKPVSGQDPSALKHISTSTTVLDWQIHSFQPLVSLNNIHFLGGYNVEEVIKKYKYLNYCVVPDWENRSVLHTLFNAPFPNDDIIISYSDTIFHKKVIIQLTKIQADVVYGYDSLWKERFSTRTSKDIKKAETVFINGRKAEFTGLMFFSKKAVEILSNLEEINVGNSLLNLIETLKKKDLVIKAFDLKGEWAELNFPDDIAKFILGTKADTLERLKPLVTKSYIGDQVTFYTSEWKNKSKIILHKVMNTFGKKKLIVRSSSKREDSWNFSNAGGFESVLNVDITDENKVINAINKVIFSYGDLQTYDEQILIQAYLTKVKISGVIFTCGLVSGSPYYYINFDDLTKSTNTVTAGVGNNLRTVIISKLNTQYSIEISKDLASVLEAVKELEQILEYDKLDIEFSVDENDKVHIFQVRPITVSHSDFDIKIEEIKKNILGAKNSFIQYQKASPFVYGKKTILANMPDWNPAELIGTRPKPLAFSLYRNLITNEVWARQRKEFGYCDIRPHILVTSLSGQPYIDVRASFNSFIPNNLSSTLKDKLVNAYLGILSENPQLHDKIEFEVVFTTWVPGFFNIAQLRLGKYNINKHEIHELENALKNITKKALTRLENDISSVILLEGRREKILNSSLSFLDKALMLLDDCKRYGTLAFSHAARAGFIATTFINSFVNNKFISIKRKNEFLMSFKTVAGNFEKDKESFSLGKLSLEDLIKKYGHLRPGTYEISNSAYWENPPKFLFPEKSHKLTKKLQFELTSEENLFIEKVLLELGLQISPKELILYIKDAIQARELVKFEFTKNISKSLDLIIKMGKELGIERDDLSYIDCEDLLKLKLNIISVEDIKKIIHKKKKEFIITQSVELPPIIQNISDFYCFERYTFKPNYVTIKKIVSSVYEFNSGDGKNLGGKIVLIPQADPGYDWLFGHGIVGLITKYGGANSHMAIRAAEIGLPSAIGVGEKLYDDILKMKKVELDCSGQTIREVI